MALVGWRPLKATGVARLTWSASERGTPGAPFASRPNPRSTAQSDAKKKRKMTEIIISNDQGTVKTKLTVVSSVLRHLTSRDYQHALDDD